MLDFSEEISWCWIIVSQGNIKSQRAKIQLANHYCCAGQLYSVLFSILETHQAVTNIYRFYIYIF